MNEAEQIGSLIEAEDDWRDAVLDAQNEVQDLGSIAADLQNAFYDLHRSILDLHALDISHYTYEPKKLHDNAKDLKKLVERDAARLFRAVQDVLSDTRNLTREIACYRV